MVFKNMNISKLLADLQDPIVVINERGLIEEVNNAALRAYDYLRNELVGQNVSILIPPEHRTNHDGYIKKYLETGEKNIIGIGREIKVQSKNGELLDYHLSVSELENEGKKFFVGLLRDLSDLKSKEREFEKNIHFFNELYNHSHLGIVRTDNNGHWIELNKAMVHLLGFDPSKANVLMNLKDLMDANQEMTEDSNEITLNTRERKRVFLRYHKIEVKGEGDYDWLIFEDITLEKELRANLYYNMNMAAIGEFVAGVAHEVNNPLAIIMSSASIVQKKCKTGKITPEEVCDYMAQIIDAVKRTSNVTNGLRGQSVLDLDYKENFSAHLIIEQTVAIAKEIFSEASIKVYFYGKASEDILFSNPGKLQQVLMHLFKNARDAMEGREKKNLEIVTMNYGNRLEISLSDNGSGIDKSIQGKIFAPFFTTKTVGKGMGLGLTYVNKMVQEMNGEIRVNSFPGEGTQFIISLPCVHHENVCKNDSDFVFEPFISKLKVLVVDDDIDQLKMIKELMSTWGIEISISSDGQEVVEKMRDGERYDFILSDLQMPGMDGVELLEDVKDIDPEVHFALNTGGYSLNLSPGKREKIRKKADSFFVKPLNLESLYKMIKKISLLKNS